MIKLDYNIITTYWGFVGAVWSEEGLYQLTVPYKERECVLAEMPQDGVESPLDGFTKELSDELNLYFRGFAVEFGVPIDWQGYTPFQKKVLQCTASIAYGELLTYGQLAEKIGNPKAARGVGGALHINRVPIVVPCHRVVGAGGKLTGYAGGLELKTALLMMEKG